MIAGGLQGGCGSLVLFLQRLCKGEADAGEFGAQLVGLGDALCGELAVGGELGDEGGFLLGALAAPGAEAVEGMAAPWG